MFLKQLLVHYVIIVIMIVIFLIVKCSSIEDVVGLSVVFTILHF